MVDLKEAAHQHNWRRTGFMDKVFVPEEQHAIEEAIIDKDVLVWVFWSMKEAAYKAHQRIYDLPRRLNWLDFRCSVQNSTANSAKGVVSIGALKYHTTTVIAKEHLHTYATPHPDLEVEVLCEIGISNYLKTRLLTRVSSWLGISISEVFIIKNSYGVPAIYRDHEQKLFSCFSLSGHGRFNAFSLSLTKS